MITPLLMTYTSPAVVIDNGSYTTKAGFALDDLPSLVFNTNYSSTSDGKINIGDDTIETNPEGEVMTVFDNGLIYNFDHIVDNWNYVYDNIDQGNKVDSKDYPLLLTEPTWNTSKNKLATTQIAFETLEVPIFALVKTPLAQLYHMNRSSGLVIDVGSSIASVTPIVDGIIQSKACFHNKYAGDFVNLHSLNYFNKKLGDDYFNQLLPKKFQDSKLQLSESFKNYYISHNVLHDFKSSILSIKSMSPILEAQIRQQQQQNNLQYNPYLALPPQVYSEPVNYQLDNDSYVTVNQDEKHRLLEPIFEPHAYQLPNISIPQPTIDKPQTQGLSQLIIFTLKSLEHQITSSFSNEHAGTTIPLHSAHAKFNETLRDLLSNIVITGGGSLANGLTERVIEDLKRSSHMYFNNYPAIQSYKLYSTALKNHPLGDINNIWDKQFGSWLGASNLASMLSELNIDEGENSGTNIALDNWFITKSDYEELGEDLVLEKFK